MDSPAGVCVNSGVGLIGSMDAGEAVGVVTGEAVDPGELLATGAGVEPGIGIGVVNKGVGAIAGASLSRPVAGAAVNPGNTLGGETMDTGAAVDTASTGASVCSGKRAGADVGTC